MNFSKLFLSTLAAVVFSASQAFAEKLAADPAHSTIQFESTHLKVSKVPGKFSDFSGTIDYNEKDPTKSTVDFTVNTQSIDTSIKKRDDHLRSADFFDVKNHPTATFKSKSIKKSGKDYKLNGDLTIRGVTKPVTFNVKSLGKVNDPVMKTDKYVFRGETELNRKDFGVSYGPDAVVSDKIKLVVNIEALPIAALEGAKELTK